MLGLLQKRIREIFGTRGDEESLEGWFEGELNMSEINQIIEEMRKAKPNKDNIKYKDCSVPDHPMFDAYSYAMDLDDWIKEWLE